MPAEPQIAFSRDGRGRRYCRLRHDTCIGMCLIGSAYAMRHHLKTCRVKDKYAGDLLAMAKTADVMINNLEDPDGLRHEV